MSAEQIAAVVADLRSRRIVPIIDDPQLDINGNKMLLAVDDAPVVDATAIYRSLVAKEREVRIYEDHNIAPPWPASLICYVNEHGNVMAIATIAIEKNKIEYSGNPWEATQECDWDQVKWITGTIVFAGGQTHGKPVKTHGPLHAWEFASYEDGTIADIHWHHLSEPIGKPLSDWDMPMMILLGTLTFFGARNVELAEPVRPRSVRRRIERTGVTVKELVVFPAGTSTRSRSGDVMPGGMPLHSVRGHYAKYGVEGRGLLFGKLAGRFWIPSHVRGKEEHGEIVHNYRIETEPQQKGKKSNG